MTDFIKHFGKVDINDISLFGFRKSMIYTTSRFQ